MNAISTDIAVGRDGDIVGFWLPIAATALVQCAGLHACCTQSGRSRDGLKPRFYLLTPTRS